MARQKHYEELLNGEVRQRLVSALRLPSQVMVAETFNVAKSKARAT